MATATPYVWVDRRHYSFEQFLHALEYEEPTIWPWGMSSHGTRGKDEWYGGYTWEQAVSLVRGRITWTRGERKIDALAREQAGKYLLKLPFIEYIPDVQGVGFDVGMVVAGQPECWYEPTPTGQGEPGLIRLVIDCMTSSGVDADTIVERMTGISAAVVTLQAMNVPLEVIAIAECDHEEAKSSYCLTVSLNTPGEPIDVKRLVALAHPAFFRRLGFRLLELTPCLAVVKAHAEYGRPIIMPPPLVTQEWGERAIYIPACHLRNPWEPTLVAIVKLVQRKLGHGTDDYEETEDNNGNERS